VIIQCDTFSGHIHVQFAIILDSLLTIYTVHGGCINDSMAAGTSFHFSPGGGEILTDFLGGGQNMTKRKCCVQKHNKITFFQNQGGAHTLPPPQNDVPEWQPASGTVADSTTAFLLQNKAPPFGA